MNNSPLHLALREMRESFLTLQSIGILILVGLVLGLSGPFQTFDALELVPRLVYWIAVCTFTYAAGSLAEGYVAQVIRQRNLPVFLQILICGGASGLAVWPVVLFINSITFGSEANHAPSTNALLFYCVAISILFSVASSLFKSATKDQTTTHTAIPKIVSRLPLNQRGDLISLSVQDHYVEVTTHRGVGLIHFRLADAIDDCYGVEGLQIHRSHWIALRAIARVFRRDGKAFVETVQGATLPISRTYLPKIKELGLL